MNAWDSTKSELSEERLAALRRWVEAGEYDSPEVIETVARRMIERGDVRGGLRDDRTDPRAGFGPLIH